MFNPQKSTVFTSPITGQLFMLAPNQPILVNSHHAHPQHLVDQYQLQHQFHQLQNQTDIRPAIQQQQFIRIGPIPSSINQSLVDLRQQQQQHHQQQQQHRLSQSSNFETHSSISPQAQLSTLQQNDLTLPNQQQQDHISVSRRRVSSTHQVEMQQKTELERSHSQPISIDMTLEKKCLTHYIDGQFIYETSKIKATKTKKAGKKKKLSPNKRVKFENRESEIGSVREQMPNWTVADVVEFIKTIPDIESYANKFEENEIDGKALLIMIDRNLNLHVLATMFKHGPAMKIEAALSKYKLDNDKTVD